MKNKVFNKRFVIGFIISLFCVMFGAFIFPKVFQIIVESNGFPTEIIVVESVVFIMIIIMLLAVLMRKEQQKQYSYQKVMTRVVILLGLYFVSVILLCMLSGLLATCVYYVLKDVLLFDQIKGIINLLISFMIFLLLPISINFFWNYIQDCQTLMASLKNILQLNFKTYCSLLIMVVALYGCGVLITTVFNFLPTGIVFTIFQMLVFTLIGGIGFSVTGSICERGGNV